MGLFFIPFLSFQNLFIYLVTTIGNIMRIEEDSIGKLELKEDDVYGINSLRSFNNFPRSAEKVNPVFIRAYLQVKEAATETNHNTGKLDGTKYSAIKDAIEKLYQIVDKCIENNDEEIYNYIIVDPYQGGAGTSLNMNMNEVIANLGLKFMEKNYGEYQYLHPLDDVNMSQSTNDTFPTALKVASIYLLRQLEKSFANLQRALQQKEDEFCNILKLGRTQFQDAVPITLGQEFGAYAQAISRDRWRLYNAEERLRSVNLGGTAIGNSIAADKDYVLSVNSALKKITGLPIAKGEDLIDTTQNLDVFTEVHGIIKAGAVSIIKFCNDLRFLSSGPSGGIGEILLPPMQAGSTIMPGKVNPVILENAIQICEVVKGNDAIIANACSAGHLELNAFAPLLAHTFLKTLALLRDSNNNLAEKCIVGIKANEQRCKSNLLNSSAIAATLINTFGYDKIQDIVKSAEENQVPFIDELTKAELVTEKELLKILSKEIGLKIG